MSTWLSFLKSSKAFLDVGVVGLVALTSIFAVYKLYRALVAVQAERVKELTEYGQRIEIVTERILVFGSAIERSLSELALAERESHRLARRHTELLHQLKGSVDTVIRDAVLARAAPARERPKESNR